MIFAYNKEQVGDVLVVILQDTKDIRRQVERKGKVARGFAEESGKTLAWNIFEASSLITIEGNGQIFLTDEDLARLNAELAKEGFSERLEPTVGPVFVVGQIVEMLAHPDSDHLNICQVAIGEDQTVQIVAGAPNAALGLKTIVALPGAIMPNGSLIFPGKLRGEESYGMMCSPRELALPNAPQKRGIIELDESAVVGEAFDPAKHWKGQKNQLK
ncbi:tRNA binding domain protein [Streptococcus pyogenes NZ131]|uniref:tRNA binding domain protein n=2 Tax=Streptococcus pyogenes TaxID=1314 RepID=A0A0H3BWH5_STRPZ|nr:DUF4479 and tRNA-binding domain-containing protein [Streptococcus pyogenes]ACI60457.1 tRNA binding domain protein [Streptococcus pyogenes NZ131]